MRVITDAGVPRGNVYLLEEYKMTPEQYLAVMARIGETGETPDLDTVRDLLEFDPNTLYRLGPGHADALLRDAMERMDELTAQLDAAHAARQTETNRATALAVQLEDVATATAIAQYATDPTDPKHEGIPE